MIDYWVIVVYNLIKLVKSGEQWRKIKTPNKITKQKFKTQNLAWGC